MKAKIKRPATIGLVSCMQQRRTGMDTRRMHLAGPPAENVVIRLGNPIYRQE